ncbi:hypothetical protein HPB50_028404 [Hyalomma asiaticum]|nr:hypothetical protein HPB50_028404 [Hyalomma asiaticum]
MERLQTKRTVTRVELQKLSDELMQLRTADALELHQEDRIAEMKEELEALAKEMKQLDALIEPHVCDEDLAEEYGGVRKNQGLITPESFREEPEVPERHVDAPPGRSHVVFPLATPIGRVRRVTHGGGETVEEDLRFVAEAVRRLHEEPRPATCRDVGPVHQVQRVDHGVVQEVQFRKVRETLSTGGAIVYWWERQSSTFLRRPFASELIRHCSLTSTLPSTLPVSSTASARSTPRTTWGVTIG